MEWVVAILLVATAAVLAFTYVLTRRTAERDERTADALAGFWQRDAAVEDLRTLSGNVAASYWFVSLDDKDDTALRRMAADLLDVDPDRVRSANFDRQDDVLKVVLDHASPVTVTVRVQQD